MLMSATTANYTEPLLAGAVASTAKTAATPSPPTQVQAL